MFNITNSNIKDSTQIIVEIINNSNTNYYLPIDFCNREVLTLLNIEERKNLFPRISLKNKKNAEVSILGYGISSLYISKFDKEKYLQNNFSVNKILKIKARDKVEIKFPFYLKTNSIYSSEYDWYDVKNNEAYNFKIEYKADINIVKTILRKSTLDSLKNMNYKMYNGKITSNKVPLIVK